MDKIEYAYSRNDNEGPWRDEDIESMINGLRYDATFSAKPGEKVTIYRGEKIAYTHADFANFIGENIQEHLQELAYDDGGEHSEGYLDDMTPDHRNELAKLVVTFLDIHCQQPAFWTVDNVEPFTIIWNEKEVQNV